MSAPPGRPPPRGPGSPPPDAPPGPEGMERDTRILARPAGPPPARPVLGPRALPPGAAVPRAPAPPTAPAPGTPGSPPMTPLDVRKPPPRSPPPPSAPSVGPPGAPPTMSPAPGAPPGGPPPPRGPLGPPPGTPPVGGGPPSGPPLSPGPPMGAPPKGPVVAAFEGGKARAPPRGFPPPDTPPSVKPGGKAAPTLPPPGSLVPTERAEGKTPVSAAVPTAGGEALPPKPVSPARVPGAEGGPVAPSAAGPPSPVVGPPPSKPIPPMEAKAPPTPSPQPPPPTPQAAAPSTPVDAFKPMASPAGSKPTPSSTATTPPTDPRPQKTPSPPNTPASPASVPGGPPSRSPARPKPPPKPGAGPAAPEKEDEGQPKQLVRPINPETGLPYGQQPAPPSMPPPPEEKPQDSLGATAKGMQSTLRKTVTEKDVPDDALPRGRKPPSEAPPPLPEEIKVVAASPAPATDKEHVILEEEVGDAEPPLSPTTAPSAPSPPSEESLVPAQLMADEAAVANTKKRLKRGRLHLYLVSAKNVRKKDQIAAPTNLNAFVVALLGKIKEPVKIKSQILKKAGAFMDFNRDELVLNISDPESLVVNNQIHLVLELWDQGAWQEEILGRGEVPVLPFMDTPGSKFEFPLTLLYPGDLTSNMTLNATAHFEHAKVGLLVFTLYEGRQLKTRGKLDNFVTVNLGDKYQKRTASIKDGRGSPYFKEEKLIMWASAANWVDDVWVRVWDDDGANNDMVGEVRFSVLPYMALTPDKFAPQVFGMTRKLASLEGEEGAEAPVENTGELVLKVEFLVAGTMSITVVEAKRLRKTNKAVGRQDPYVVLKMEGQAVALTRKTKVDKDGGSEPVWNETLIFEIVDQYLLEVEVWDQDMRGKDEMIGKCSFSLLSVFKKGYIDTWVVVKRPGEDGSPEESGDVHVVFDFWGPSGIAYPQYQPSVDSYDERARTNLPDDQRGVSKKQQQQQQAAKHKKDKPSAGKGERSYEFTDDEIEEAFKFIDLDKNSFIGAAEVRHILVCMGELVTDEEIDAMIHLVDADGDGQVSLKEFHKMVIHPNPAQYDCRATKEAEASNQQEEKKADYDREREMAEREEKRKLFTVLTQDNAIGVVESRKIFDRYRNLSMKMTTKGTDFDLFCSLLGVLPTGQYHKLFNLYDREGGGYLDMKEFILGLFNFVNMEKEEKVSLIFQLFDEDRSGFLSEEEVREILKATHLQTADAVKAKLQTLMKQVKSPDRTLSYEEFVVIAKKFPTILFPPNIGKPSKDDDDGGGGGVSPLGGRVSPMGGRASPLGGMK